MNEITIWHNPKCSKSRNTMALLQEKSLDIKVITYLENRQTKEELISLLAKLDMSPRELMRTKEDIYVELKLSEVNDDTKLIEAMVQHPNLIERPIVIRDDRAVIGRPIENVIELLS